MFSKKDSRNMQSIWGHEFEWTPEHQTRDQMRPLTHTYDVLGSKCLDRLDELSPPPKARPQESKPETTDKASVPAGTPRDGTEKPPSPPRRDLYALLEKHHATDPTLSAFWTEVHTVPDWVDWAQIQRGQEVFCRYGVPSILALTFQSLIGGMAARRVVETLARTGGFGAKVARRRLLETFQHQLECTRDLASLQPGGAGFASSVRVRLLHAHVRRRIVALAGRDPAYFDLAGWGVPVNDLDCVGTVLSFSAALVWIGLPRQGIYLREDEIVDYHALWRYIAYVMGTPADTWLVDWRRSKIFLESIMVAELTPSEMSKTLANNTITALSCQPPTYTSREFMCAEAHWLIGRELSDALGIARPTWVNTALVATQCVYLKSLSYLCRSVPSWDKARNERVRKFFYKVTVQDEKTGLGRETIFDFKFVPQLDLTTVPGGPEDPGRLRRPFGAHQLHTLVRLLLGTAVLGAVAWLLGLRSGVGWAGGW